jgi:hypothetical protein
MVITPLKETSKSFMKPQKNMDYLTSMPKKYIISLRSKRTGHHGGSNTRLKQVFWAVLWCS